MKQKFTVHLSSEYLLQPETSLLQRLVLPRVVGRLERVVTKEVSVLFNSRDSFLWFGLFARFVELETDDGRFVKFMDEFNHSLHGKPIDGLSYDDILAQSKATKDKSVVRKKLNHLEQLMWEYLNIPDVKLEAKSY